MTRIITPPYIKLTPSLTGRLHCDEKELLESRFLIPNLQPLANVSLDKDHPYYPYLERFYWFREAPIELKNKNMLTLDGTGSAGVPYIHVHDKNVGVYCNQNYKYYRDSDFNVKGSTTPLLILSRAKNYNQVNSYNNIIYEFYYDYNAKFTLYRKNFATTLRARAQLFSGTTECASTTSVRDSGFWFTAAHYIEWDSPKQELYINGVLESSNTDSVGSTGALMTSRIFNASGNESADAAWNGTVIFIIIIQGLKFSSDMITNLSKNPYQLLKPSI